jgi:hypothetical protein
MFCLFTYIEIIEKNRTISFVPTLLPTFSGWQDGTEYPREGTGRAEGAGVGVSACPHYIPKLGGSIPNMGTRIGQLEIYEIEVGGP